jgi:hypothetical protein
VHTIPTLSHIRPPVFASLAVLFSLPPHFLSCSLLLNSLQSPPYPPKLKHLCLDLLQVLTTGHPTTSTIPPPSVQSVRCTLLSTGDPISLPPENNLAIRTVVQTPLNVTVFSSLRHATRLRPSPHLAASSPAHLVTSFETPRSHCYCYFGALVSPSYTFFFFSLVSTTL